MAYNLPGGFANFIPTAVASLQSTFSQNPKSFALNQYAQVVPVNQPVGYWRLQDPNAQIRLNYTNNRDAIWMPGTMPNVNFAQGNQYVQYSCIRYHQTFVVDDVAMETAAPIYDVLADSANAATSRLMNIRTNNVLNTLTTAANWTSNGVTNTSTATSLGGGLWSAATSTNRYIQKSIFGAIQQIQKSTAADISPEDLALVISPATAYAASESDEIQGYLKSSFVSKEFLENTPASGFWYGLVDPLYSVRVIVEKAVKNTGPENGTAVVNYMLGNSAVIVNRPGQLIQSQYNTMTTMTLAMYKDLNMLVEYEPLGQLSVGNLFDFYVPVIQPFSGYLITSVV